MFFQFLMSFLQFALVILKLRGTITWEWVVVFIPFMLQIIHFFAWIFLEYED